MLTSILSVVILASTATPSHDPAKHRLRVHGETQLMQGEVRFFGSDRTQKFTLLQPSLALGLGYAVVPWVVVGARVGGSVKVENDGPRNWVRESRFEVSFVPYVEVRPLPRRRVQPFVLAEAGTGYSDHRLDEASAGWTRSRRSRQLSPRVGARVGLHAFVLPRLSIDADVGVMHAWDHVLCDRPRLFARTLRLGASAGVSGWF